MTHASAVQIALFWFAMTCKAIEISWHRFNEPMRIRRAHIGRHGLDQSTYYGTTAHSIVMRLRHERGVVYA